MGVRNHMVAPMGSPAGNDNVEDVDVTDHVRYTPLFAICR